MSTTLGMQKAAATEQNDRPTKTKPSRETIQKMLATVLAVEGDSEGNSHDRAGNQPPVFVPGL